MRKKLLIIAAIVLTSLFPYTIHAEEPETTTTICEPNMHDFESSSWEDATCSESGSEIKTCKICGYEEVVVTPPYGHYYEPEHDTRVIKSATPKSNGKSAVPCVECGTLKYSTISKPSVYEMSATSFTYTGKVQRPTVVVKNAKGQLIDKDFYTVNYNTKNSKAVGTYKITVKFIQPEDYPEFYQGTVTLTYKIVPKNKGGLKLSAGKKCLTAKWSRDTSVNGYVLRYSTKSNMSGAKKIVINPNSRISYTIKNLRSGKYYYIQLCSYKKINKVNHFSKWCKAKKIKVK